MRHHVGPASDAPESGGMTLLFSDENDPNFDEDVVEEDEDDEEEKTPFDITDAAERSLCVLSL